MKIVNKHVKLDEIDYREGAIILIDKPYEWSSFSVVNKLRWKLRHHYNIKKIKVGHSGTLDPLATGLMMVFTGKATKSINEYMGMDKVYDAKVKFGCTTASYDAEQQEEDHKDISGLSQEQITIALESFKGEQLQTAPVFSALKVNGQPMYKMARKGIDVERKTRKVIFHEVDFQHFESPILDVSVACSKGTYIRSFAHDLGQKLEVGGYLNGLIRTSVGEFKLEDAISVDDFVSAMNNN